MRPSMYHVDLDILVSAYRENGNVDQEIDNDNLKQGRRGHGWAAVRRGDEITGDPAVAARHTASAGCRCGSVSGDRVAGEEPGRIQLHLHWMRLRDRYAAPVQQRVGVLRVVARHSGRGWRLLQSE